MANEYAPIAFTEAWYETKERDFMQRNENRASIYGILDTALIDNKDKLLSNETVEKLRTAAERPVKIPVLQKEATGAGTARVCAGTGVGGSAVVTPTWGTINEQFSVSVDQLLGTSILGADTILRQRMRERIKSAHARLDTAGNAFLVANKSAGLGTVYTRVTNDAQVPLADHRVSPTTAALWLNNVSQEMFENDYAPMYNIIGSAGVAASLRPLLAQGAGNQTNLAFQDGEFMKRFSNRIAVDTANDVGTAFIMPEGMFTLLTWTKPKNRTNIEALGFDGVVNSGGWLIAGNDIWGQVIDPVYGFPWEVKIKVSCNDNSANMAEAQDDLLYQVSMSFDYAYLKAYTSDANTGIYKYELKKI